MSQEIDHISLANKNHDTLAYLIREAESHSEWVATVAFYKAVQIIEAMFYSIDRTHSNGHDSRIERLKRPEFREIFKAYRPLYAASLVARYLEDSSPRKFDGGKSQAYQQFADYLKPADVFEKLVRRRLDVLEQHAISNLSKDSQSTLKRACHLQGPAAEATRDETALAGLPVSPARPPHS